MLLSIIRREWSKELPSIYKLCTLFTLANKMADDKVVQLCGSDTMALRLALRHLRKGDIIAVPTDTVYGLAVDASNSAAIASLYEVKGRDTKKPLAICVGAVGDVKSWAVTKELPKGLLKELLPGPVTVLLNRKERLNPDLNPGVKKVGVRVVEATWYPFVTFVAASLGYPLALTSANLSNEPNCLYVEEFKSLWPKLAVVFDTSVNKVEEPISREGSTIVDLSEPGKFMITRPGVAHVRTLKILKKYGLEQLT